MLFAVVNKGDAYLSAPPGGFRGGVRSLSSPCPPRSVSVATRTVFLLPEEQGTVLGAPRGVPLCRDITNFAMVSHHTRQGRSPGTLHCNAGYDPHK